MRIVPNPWGKSGFDYLKAIVIAFVLLAGLMLSIQRGSWIALVWLVLLAAAVITWTRDLMTAVKHKG